MNTISPYRLRYYVQILLCAVIISFFIYTTIDQLVHKQFYIKRYVEIYYEIINDQHHHSRQPPTVFNHTKAFNVTDDGDDNEIQLDANEVLDHTLGTFETKPTPSFESDVRLVSTAIISIILLIELVYCFIFVYIVTHPTFCPMLCFATLSFTSLVMRVYQYLASVDEHDAHSAHRPSSFFDHVDSLDLETTWEHITSANLIEIVFASVETVLAIIFVYLIKRYPFLRRRNRQIRMNNNRTAILNGDVVEMRDIGDDQHAENVNLMENGGNNHGGENRPRVMPLAVAAYGE